jgi:tRNA/tmRNA/rRNA uracil-C5-methylase (TrmA/RlmC/RlmD family)
MGRRKVKILEQVEITDIAEKGRGVGRDATGRVVFVKDTAPGDIVDVRVVKKKKGFMQGVPLQFHKYSEQRVEPFLRALPSMWRLSVATPCLRDASPIQRESGAQCLATDR